MKRYSILPVLLGIFIILGFGPAFAAADGSSDAASDVIVSADGSSEELAADAVSDGSSEEMAAIAAVPADETIPRPLIFSAGEQVLGASLGIVFPTALSTARAMMDFRLEYQYFLPASVSLAAGVAFGTGFARTNQFLASVGARYHYALPWPADLVFGLDFAGGGLFNVRNADLGYLGGRVTVGGNYYLRAGKFKEAVGVALVADIGSSISERNAAYATIGLVFSFNYHIR